MIISNPEFCNNFGKYSVIILQWFCNIKFQADVKFREREAII